MFMERENPYSERRVLSKGSEYRRGPPKILLRPFQHCRGGFFRLCHDGIAVRNTLRKDNGIIGRETMSKKLDPKEIVSFEELLMSEVNTQEALINLLDKKGIIKKEELIDEIKRIRGKDKGTSKRIDY